LDEARQGIAIFEEIPIRYLKPDLGNTLAIAQQLNLYAYDAYFLDSAIRYNAPLLTLDRQLMTAAKNLNVVAWEV